MKARPAPIMPPGPLSLLAAPAGYSGSRILWGEWQSTQTGIFPGSSSQRRPSPWRLEATNSRPRLLPEPREILEPSPETWVVASDARVLYLPRTLVNEDPALQDRLRTLAKG